MKGSSKSNEELDDVLVSMLEYGARTQKYFDYKLDRLANDTYYEIKLDGGHLDDLSSHGLFKENEEINIGVNGDEFIYWINKDTSEIYSYNREETIKLTSDLSLKAITERPYSKLLEYSLINDDQEYEVIGIGECEDTEIVLPKKYNGKMITKVSENAFKDCTNIKSITVQEGVIEIGNYAFSGCTSLEFVSLPGTIDDIGENAFYNCTSLKDILMPISYDITTIDYFETCTKLENIFFTGPVIGLESNLNIDKYRILLYSEEYKDDMICDENFYWHYEKDKPTIWDKASNGLVYTDKGDYLTVMSYHLTEEILYIPSFYDGKPVKEISFTAFHSNDYIKKVYIGKNVEKIGGNAFARCESLTDVYMGNFVKEIDSACFDGCTKLVNIKLSKSLTNISDNTFSNCESLAYIEIPEGVTSIGGACFMYCNKLRSLVIPSSLESFGDFVFQGINEINIYYKGDSESIRDIIFGNGESVFNIRNIYYYNEEWNYEPGNYWHYNDNGEAEILLDDRLIIKNWDECAGRNENYIGTIVIPAIYNGKKIKGIAMRSFNDDGSINELILEEGIEYIDIQSFSGCMLLLNVHLPKSLTEIGSNTFLNCPNLTNIFYNGTKEEFEKIKIDKSSGIITYDINICYYSDAYPSDDENTYWHYVNGKTIIWETPNSNINYVLINDDTEYEASLYGGSEEKNIIVASKIGERNITSIGNNAFKDNTYIEYVYLPESIEVIGDYAFECCESLEYIEMPDSITKIGDNAFKGCLSLDIVNLPTSLEEIGAHAFDGTNIKDIILPLSVKTIGDDAFDNIESLENVYYLGTLEDFKKITIGDNNTDFISKVKYYQPVYDQDLVDSVYWHYIDGVPTIWKTTNGLTFKLSSDETYYILINSGTFNENVVVIPATYNGLPVTEMRTLVFYSLDYLEHVYVPDTITVLPGNGFMDCFNLKKVVLPDNITEIGVSEFALCENLKSIILPASVKKICTNAFLENCYIEKIYYMGNSTEFSEIEGSDTEVGSMTIYYYSKEEPTTEGNYFHIVDGEAVEW